MDRIFVDANVIIDFLLDRDEAQFRSKEFISKALTTKKLYISALTMHITIYVLKPTVEERVLLSRFFENFDVISLTGEDAMENLSRSGLDYEDELQFTSAIRKCQVIVTRDTKDYKSIAKQRGEDIQILTPKRWLKSNA